MCKHTGAHATTGASRGGRLPSPVEHPVRSRPVGVRNRKTRPCNSLRRSTSAHVRRATVGIDPLRQLRSPVRAQAVRRSSGVRRWPAGRLSDVWAEAHRVTGTGVERAKHVRVPAVDESRGAAATATATPRSRSTSGRRPRAHRNTIAPAAFRRGNAVMHRSSCSVWLSIPAYQTNGRHVWQVLTQWDISHTLAGE